jgi:hypothetical protein
MATVALVSPGPSTPVSVMARMIGGIENITSTARMSSMSSRPPT